MLGLKGSKVTVPYKRKTVAQPSEVSNSKQPRMSTHSKTSRLMRTITQLVVNGQQIQNVDNVPNNNLQPSASPVLPAGAQQATASAPFLGHQSLSPPQQQFNQWQHMQMMQNLQLNPWMSIAPNTVPFQMMPMPQQPVWVQMQ